MMGKTLAPLAAQPLVQVTAGPAVALQLSGLADATAGTAQNVTVTALDTFNNVATGYTGQVQFASNDAQATLPSHYVLTPADAGAHTFSVTLKTAGSKSVTVTDTMTMSLTDTKTISITAGPLAAFTVTLPPLASGGDWPPFGGPLFLLGDCATAPIDAYGNSTPTSDTIQWTSTDPLAVLPHSGPFVPLAFYFCNFGTAGSQTLTVTDTDHPSIKGSISFTVASPEAVADEVTVLDPTHNGGALYTLNVVNNDVQTLGPNGNPFFLPSFKDVIHDITQPQYTSGDQTFQVGVLHISDDGHLLVWDLKPT